MSLFGIAGQPADRLAIVSADGATVSYGELARFADGFGSMFGGERKLGFILARNTVGSLKSYIGCLESGAIVPLMLDSELDAASLTWLFDHYRPQYALAPIGHTACTSFGEPVFSYDDYAVYDTSMPACGLHGDLALLLTTSGSTGTSKLVRLSYSNVKANAESIAAYLDIDSNERAVTSLPMNYSYGLSVINSHILMGATMLLTNASVMQKEFWEFVREGRATSIAGVPYTYQMFKRLRLAGMDLPALRTLTQAGGKLPIELQKHFGEYARETGRRFFVMYGQTEATARMSYLPCGDVLEKVGSIGIAIPGGRFSLLDENGREIAEPDAEGELMYQGPNVSMGYATQREDLLEGDANGGVLITGDMARFDEDGYFYITGRKKRFLKMFGKRTSLDECEQIVSDRFGIECACAGRDDLLCAYVVDSEKAGEVREYLARRLELHPLAIKVRVIDEIPRNDSGKITYKELPEC